MVKKDKTNQGASGNLTKKRELNNDGFDKAAAEQALREKNKNKRLVRVNHYTLVFTHKKNDNPEWKQNYIDTMINK